MDIEADLRAVERIFIDYPNLLNELIGERKNIDEEIQDILHVFEFGTLNAIQRTKLSNELINLRKRRRVVKNQIELFEEVKRFSKGRVKKNEVRNVMGKIRTIESNQTKRFYKMRIREDLQELVKD